MRDAAAPASLFKESVTQSAQAATEPGALQRWSVRQQVRWWNLLGQPRRTAQVLEDVVRRFPLWGDGVEGLAFAMAGNGRQPQAIALLQTLVAREPQRANAWFNLGYLLQQQGSSTQADNDSGAVFALRRATEIDPQNDRAWYGLALELIAQGQLQDALPCLKACTRIQPMSPYAWYQLGRTHHELGLHDEARKVLAHLKTFDPKVSAQLQRELQVTARVVAAD